ncbi:zinc finger CCCH domain-containing protein 11A-like isoform X2 [Planococcus citri]|uniref:zinc finger CCCH domain-containing protein 11A-like isoform X2 n=1 Tax=Planococcus citri TaxID=170843 RepID=UPI0031F85E97
MTNKSNEDCYYYYYSTCQKAELCPFRHEPTALGCETVCQDWKLKKCAKQHCNLRHMLLKKNRQEIPCYWESQPTGCLKPHCAFRHVLPRPTMVAIREGLRNTSGN